MRRYIFILGLFFTAYAQTQRNCPGECRINVPSTSVCVIQKDPEQCLKIKECTLNEMNCARWRQNIPLLSRSKIDRCSLIKGATGSARCTTVKNCHNIKCDNDKVNRCQRVGNLCRLLTNCEARKENCRRAPNNQLRAVNNLACKGLKRSDGFKPCKPLKRRTKKKKKTSGVKKILKG